LKKNNDFCKTKKKKRRKEKAIIKVQLHSLNCQLMIGP